MLTFTYTCKKTGLAYDFTSELDANAQDAYAWRRGLREYMDNYHASMTKAGLTSAKGTKPWRNEAEFIAAVTEACEEAQSRFNIGDVPGERVPADPKVVELRKLGVTETEWQIMKAAVDAARKAA
jgi:hypothetical protein